MRSGSIALPSASFSRTRRPRAHGRPPGVRLVCRQAGTELSARKRRIIKHAPLRMEDFVVTCPLAPDVPHLLSGSCYPDQVRGRRLPFSLASGELLALSLRISFGLTSRLRPSTSLRINSPGVGTCLDLSMVEGHPTSPVPCPAHTTGLTSRAGAFSAHPCPARC